MQQTQETVANAEDEYGIDRKKFALSDGKEESKFFKLKDGEAVEITVAKDEIEQTQKEFAKFSNGEPILKEDGTPEIERVGWILKLTIDSVNGKPTTKTWEVTSKKLCNTILSFLDKKETNGQSYLFSRVFSVERRGIGKATSYILYPTQLRSEQKQEKIIGV